MLARKNVKMVNNQEKKNQYLALAAISSIWTLLLSTIASMGGAGSLLQAAYASSSTTTYTVVSGDTLYKIGLRFGVPWQDIAQANDIQSPYLIYVGDVLVIPLNDASDDTTAIATGNPMYDQFDSYIKSSSRNYGISDQMLVKAMISQESYFDPRAVSPDSPCGVPPGWTDAQSKSFGLMQFTPACAEPQAGPPNLTTDTTSPYWSSSWFNPQYNIDRGVQALSRELSYVKSNFYGCSDEQYLLMAVATYNSGPGAVYGCGSWNERADTHINYVLSQYKTYAEMAGAPYPYAGC